MNVLIKATQATLLLFLFMSIYSCSKTEEFPNSEIKIDQRSSNSMVFEGKVTHDNKPVEANVIVMYEGKEISTGYTNKNGVYTTKAFDLSDEAQVTLVCLKENLEDGLEKIVEPNIDGYTDPSLELHRAKESKGNKLFEPVEVDIIYGSLTEPDIAGKVVLDVDVLEEPLVEVEIIYYMN